MTSKRKCSLDRIARSFQNLLGPNFTRYTQRHLGRKATRFIREILGRSPRHRVQVRCNKQRFGRGVNSWVVCPDLLGRGSVVYSLGVGTDITFDLDLIAVLGVHVFAFDPTPTAVSWLKSQHPPDEFHFFDLGVSDKDGLAKFYSLGDQCTTVNIANASDFVEFRVNRLTTIMERLGHTRIDLLKVDIEGEEYAVMDDLVRCGLSHRCRQLLVEFHHRFLGVGIPQTDKAIRILNRQGYRIFNVSESGDEYSFLQSQ